MLSLHFLSYSRIQGIGKEVYIVPTVQQRLGSHSFWVKKVHSYFWNLKFIRLFSDPHKKKNLSYSCIFVLLKPPVALWKPESVSSTKIKVKIAKDIYLQMWKGFDILCEKHFLTFSSTKVDAT